MAWCALGQADRAEAALAEVDDDRDARGLLERARGRVAQARHHTEEALAHYESSAEADATGRPDVEVARLHVLWELRRFDEIEERVRVLEDSGALADDGWPERARANVVSLAALASFGLGRADEARDRLQRLLERIGDDPATRAPVLQNLATIVRRSGGAVAAEPLLREAVALLDATGRLQGVAQLRAALGTTLRELGRLVEADRELGEALAMRERLGDAAGAAITRGSLGLVRADRGHLRSALLDFEAAERDFAPAARTRWSPLLRARAAELRARLDGGTVDVVDAGLDPREFLYRARAAFVRGEREAGSELLERAASLARRLDLAPVREEAEVAASTARGVVHDEPTRDATAREDARVGAYVLAEHVLGPDDARDALELARELAARGRDDRAARLALVVANSETSRDDALELARSCLALCEVGMSAREVLASRRSLLGLPDPRPADLDVLAEEESEELEDDMALASLLEINHRLVQQEDQTALLGEIVEQALTVTGAERGFLVLEVDGELEFDTAIDSARGDIERPELEVSRSVVRNAIRRQEALRVSNATEDPRLGAAPSVAQLDLRSVLCAPFEVEEGLRGAIYVDHRLQSGAFGQRSQRLLELLADQAALAIRQVRRIEEIRALNAQLSERVERQETDLESARRSLRAVGLPAPAGGLVGQSNAMQQVRALVERVAPSDLSVLVNGQSGTGKELVARALHELSARRRGPFVTENCASLPESLIESELFGYERGAFTGAERSREGLFERASGGTLFLDEIGEMPRELQSKLLRVLETREVRRLGDDRPRPVDVRLVTATNRDLTDEVREGRFREDLYYRVAGMVVRTPPLSERVEDVPALVEHFLAQQRSQDGVRRAVSKDVLAALARRSWPGNVRELRNEVVRLCVLSAGDLVDTGLVSAPGPTMSRSTSPSDDELVTIAELERRAILRAIERLGGDKREAAKVLGISLSKLYERLKKWREDGLETPD
ncbi:MAG: sigma-54-dependent Fis family transcriptional regulator [Planctomycetota bacterium]